MNIKNNKGNIIKSEINNYELKLNNSIELIDNMLNINDIEWEPLQTIVATRYILPVKCSKYLSCPIIHVK